MDRTEYLRRVQQAANDLVAAAKQQAKPALRVVKTAEPIPAELPPARMDAQTREWHMRMIRHLRKRWGMVLIVDQALLGRGSLDELEDDELVALHNNMHRAHECIDENITWEDAGLIHNRTGTF